MNIKTAVKTTTLVLRRDAYVSKAREARGGSDQKGARVIASAIWILAFDCDITLT